MCADIKFIVRNIELDFLDHESPSFRI